MINKKHVLFRQRRFRRNKIRFADDTAQWNMSKLEGFFIMVITIVIIIICSNFIYRLLIIELFIANTIGINYQRQ